MWNYRVEKIVFRWYSCLLHNKNQWREETETATGIWADPWGKRLFYERSSSCHIHTFNHRGQLQERSSLYLPKPKEKQEVMLSFIFFLPFHFIHLELGIILQQSHEQTSVPIVFIFRANHSDTDSPASRGNQMNMYCVSTVTKLLTSHLMLIYVLIHFQVLYI